MHESLEVRTAVLDREIFDVASRVDWDSFSIRLRIGSCRSAMDGHAKRAAGRGPSARFTVPSWNWLEAARIVRGVRARVQRTGRRSAEHRGQ